MSYPLPLSSVVVPPSVGMGSSFSPTVTLSVPSNTTLPVLRNVFSITLIVFDLATRPFSKCTTVAGLMPACPAKSATFQSNPARAMRHCFGVTSIPSAIMTVIILSSNACKFHLAIILLQLVTKNKPEKCGNTSQALTTTEPRLGRISHD